MIDNVTIDSALMKLNDNANLAGFWYSRVAIREIIDRMDEYRYGCLITKTIYPFVAKKIKSKPACVERSIRSYISVSYEENQEEFDRLGFKRKPTNGAFLMNMAVNIINTYGTDEDRKTMMP